MAFYMYIFKQRFALVNKLSKKLSHNEETKLEV